MNYFKLLLSSILCSIILVSCQETKENAILYKRIHPAKSLDHELSSIDFQSKFTLVDFWATWCAPCIKGFGHLDKLANNPELNKKYNFVIISDEDETKIKKRLADKNLNFISLVDSLNQKKSKCGFKGKTFSEFNICALPTAVILDAKGKEIWRGQTKKLTVEQLNKIYNNEDLSNKSKANSKNQSKPKSVAKIDTIQTAEYIFLATEGIKESNRSSTASDFSRFSVKGHSAEDLLMKITNENDYKFKIDETLNGRYFSIKYQSKVDDVPEDDHRALVFDLFLNNFSMEVDTIQKQINSMKLKISDSKLLEQARSIEPDKSFHSGYDYDTDDKSGKIVIINSKLETLAKIINDYFESPFILSEDIRNETRYDIIINYQDTNDILKILKDKYGLSFESNEAMIRVYELREIADSI